MAPVSTFSVKTIVQRLVVLAEPFPDGRKRC